MALALIEMTLVGIIVSYLIVPFLDGQGTGQVLEPKRKDAKNP